MGVKLDIDEEIDNINKSIEFEEYRLRNFDVGIGGQSYIDFLENIKGWLLTKKHAKEAVCEKEKFIPPDGYVTIPSESYKKMEEENRNMRNIIKNMRKIKDLSNSLLERIDYIDDGDYDGCESG